MTELVLLVFMTLCFILYGLYEAKESCLHIVTMCLIIAAILCSMSFICIAANVIVNLFERC